MCYGRLLATLVLMGCAAEVFAAGPPSILRDTYGDPLPFGAIARLGSKRLRMPRQKSGTMPVFSPDGRLLATLGWPIRIWDTTTGRLLRELHHQEFRESGLAFSPDGKALVSAHDDLMIWNLQTGKGERLKVEKDPGEFRALAIRPDGRMIAVVSEGLFENARLLLYDIEKRKTLASIDLGRPSRRPSERTCLAFSPDGKSLAVGDSWANAAGAVRVWGVTSQKQIAIAEFGQEILALAYAPDSKSLAVHPFKGNVSLLELAGNEPKVVSLELSGDFPSALRFREGGKTLLFASGDGSVREIEIAGQRKSRKLVSASKLSDSQWESSVVISPCCRRVAYVGDRVVRLWDLKTGKEHPRFEDHRDGSYIEAMPCPRGQRIVTRSDTELRIWEFRTGKLLWVMPGKDFGWGLSWTPDGRHVVARDEGQAGWWDVESGRLTRRTKLPAGNPDRMHLLSDGRTLSCQFGYLDTSFRLLDASSGKLKRHLPASANHGADLSPDGNWLLRCGGHAFSGKTIRLQEVSTGRTVWKADCGLRPIFAFSQDSRHLLTYDDTGADARHRSTGRLVGPRVEVEEAGVNGLTAGSVGPGAWMFVVGVEGEHRREGWMRSVPTTQVLLLETRTGKIRHRFPPAAGLHSSSFSHNGRHWISVGEDGSALVWDLPSIASRSLTARTWDDLGSSDARVAFVALSSLAASPERALALISKGVVRVRADAKQVGRWIEDLDSDSFAARVEAEKQLAVRGDEVEEDLLRVLVSKPSFELYLRVDRLIRRLEQHTPDQLRRLRSVELLELIGSPEAQGILKKLSAGYPGSRLTREAKEALGRVASAR